MRTNSYFSTCLMLSEAEQRKNVVSKTSKSTNDTLNHFLESVRATTDNIYVKESRVATRIENVKLEDECSRSFCGAIVTKVRRNVSRCFSKCQLLHYTQRTKLADNSPWICGVMQ